MRHPLCGRFRALRLALIFLLAVAFTSCGDDSTPTPTPSVTLTETASPAPTSPAGEANLETIAPVPTPAPTPVTGTLVLWHSWAQADGDALAQILTDFMRRYPELRVETLFVAHDELLQSYAEAVQSGGGPDLLLAPNWWLLEMVELGITQPLDAMLSPDDLPSSWPAALDNLRWQETLYGLPTHFNLIGLYVNQPLASGQAQPLTTGDLLNLARQSTSLGTGLYAGLFHLYWGFPAFGAKLVDSNGHVTLDVNDGAATYLSWLADLNETEGSHVDLDYGMLLDRFKKGEFAFFVDGPWSLADLRGALGSDLALAPLPAGPVGPARPWMYADGVFLNPIAAPQQQQLALLLARHIAGPEAGAHMAQVAERLPANMQADLGDDPILAGFVAQAANAEAMPALAEMDQIFGYGGDMIVQALSRTADPATIISETTALINDATGK